jgi:parvulin-like peptidyl-prolyl isomerase
MNESPVEQTSGAPIPTPRPAGKKKHGKAPIIIVIVIILAALGVAAYLMGIFDSNSTTDPAAVGSTQDPATVVATVNGKEITRGDLDERMEQVRQSLPVGALDPAEDAAFESQLLDEVINLELLTMLAEERNFTVSDDEIDAEITVLQEQFGGAESFAGQLAALGLTEDELRKNMRNELLIRQLIDADTNINELDATDEELRTVYDEAVAIRDDAPPFEQVQELIRAQVIQQKSAEAVDAYIQEARAAANIQINL